MSHDLKLLSDLLDEALDLDAAASEEFLEKMEKMHPALAPTLRDMLRVRATLSTDQLIALNGRAYTVQSAQCCSKVHRKIRRSQRRCSRA
jgi:hypothetical protein